MAGVKFVTLGCKVNQYETQAMRESLREVGVCEEEGTPDYIVINTCTVTAEADRENRYWVRRLRRENPGARIVVTGCWVQRNRREADSLAGVDLVLSNEEKPDLRERLLSLFDAKREAIKMILRIGSTESAATGAKGEVTVSPGQLILAILQSSPELSTRLADVMDRIRKACEEP